MFLFCITALIEKVSHSIEVLKVVDSLSMAIVFSCQFLLCFENMICLSSGLL